MDEAAFRLAVRAHLDLCGRSSRPVQIAFYGGTFTGMARDEQLRLLQLASPFLDDGSVDGIRISTRPDEIDAEGLDLIKGLGVTTVELGAQSLDDEVLLRSRRGHTSMDIFQAVSLLKTRDFQTGIHLMAGLPGDTEERFKKTIDKTISLHPDTVRIHPTIVLRDTPLADAFREGHYVPLTLTEAVTQCKNALKKLTAARIPVIRLGLQTTAELEKKGVVVAGPFHPAFRSLVESAIFLDLASALLACSETGKGSAAFTAAPADVSNLYGHRRINFTHLRERFHVDDIRITVDPSLPRGELILTTAKGSFKADRDGNISTVSAAGLHAGL